MIRINPEWRYEPFGPFDTCPECLGPLTPVPSFDEVNFYCPDCNACWHVSMGYLTRLDPATCPGFTPPPRDSSDATMGRTAPVSPVAAPAGGR